MRLAVLPIIFLSALRSRALNIIVNNDDGFGSANIREFYRLLNAAGHNGEQQAPKRKLRRNRAELQGQLGLLRRSTTRAGKEAEYTRIQILSNLS